LRPIDYQLEMQRGFHPVKLAVPGEMCPLGLKLPNGLSFEQWQMLVAQLRMIMRACMWWWGDALAYGERRYGVMYKQALDRADYDYQTLRDAAWVSGRFELSRRRDKLTWSHHREVAALEPQQQDALLDQAESERMTRDQLRRAVRRFQAEQKLRAAMALVLPTTEAPDVRCCSMQELLGGERNIDAIICDPPYGEEYIPLYGELARLARLALKPGGSLVVMVGHQHLDRLLADMCPYMPYRWIIRYETGDPCTRIFSRRVVNVAWKPVLVFGEVMGDAKWIHRDAVRSDAADKRFHPWQQSESGMSKLIDYLTRPGDLVVDPFLGTGTTGVACARLGRRFVGCDVDAEQVDMARARCALAQAEAVAPLSGRIPYGSDGCGGRIGPFRCCTCVCGDAEKLMSQLPRSSTDAVVTDAPYGVGAEVWDGKVPYHLLSRFLQVTDGPVVWFGAAPAIGDAYAMFDPKPDRMLIWAPAFTNSHTISDGLQFRYHAIYCWRLPKRHDGPVWDVLNTPTERGNWWKHSCTKPLALMEQLCRFVPEGGVVLDPFAGSGSTLVAARNCGQHFLGFEKDPAHCDVAVKRLLKRSAVMNATRDGEEAA
jgi:DNA modification methylase